MKNTTKNTVVKENLTSEKEKRGEIRKNFKKFYFPEINKTVEAENMEKATKKAREIAKK